MSQTQNFQQNVFFGGGGAGMGGGSNQKKTLCGRATDTYWNNKIQEYTSMSQIIYELELT